MKRKEGANAMSITKDSVQGTHTQSESSMQQHAAAAACSSMR
jgi:hypothetical protein